MDATSQKAAAKLKEIWHRVDALYDHYAKSHGLSFVALLVIQTLHEEPDIYTQTELCDKLGLPKQLVNTIIKTLWEQHFVELKEARDRRNKKIHLTHVGRDYAALVLRPLEAAEAAALESFSCDEIVKLSGMLEKYTAALERVLKNGGSK